MIQSLVRLMPDLHKTLLLASLHLQPDGTYTVEELAMTSEHAPFRHKHVERTQKATRVGAQRKRQRDETKTSSEQTPDASTTAPP